MFHLWKTSTSLKFFFSEQEIKGESQLQLEGMKLAIMDERILDSVVMFLGHWNWLPSI